MTRYRASLVATLCFCVVVAAGTARAQTTSVSGEPVVHFPPLPPSIPQLVASVDLVVVGRMIGSSGPRVETDGLNRQSVRRYQQIVVDEFIKGAPPAGSKPHITVRQAGGTADLNGKQVSEQILQRLLMPGDTAVLFLRPVPGRPDAYYIAYGPSGILVIDKDRMVELTPQMQRMGEFLNRKRVPVDEVLGLLRGASE